MRTLHFYLWTVTLLVMAALTVSACDEDRSELLEPDGAQVQLSKTPLESMTLTQQDRFGIPAINTLFVSAASDKNAFNRAAPENDASDFTATAVATIMARFAVSEANATALAGLVLPDVQPLGDLSGALFAGRRLSDDVVDLVLGVLFGPTGLSDAAPAPGLASDFVDGNDKPFLAEFPYLATPHTP